MTTREIIYITTTASGLLIGKLMSPLSARPFHHCDKFILGHYRYTKIPGLGQLAAGVLTSYDKARLL
jgi:hypothetical protein